MSIRDNFDEATKFSQATTEFLETHQIPPSPINYSVIYLYSSKRNDSLTAELDKHLASSKTIDLILLEQLYEKYISNAHLIENEILAPIEKSLATTINKINAQVDSNNNVSSNLERAERVLANQDYHQSIQNVMNYIISSISESQQQHNELSQELTRTCGEVNFLKAKLETARNEAMIDALTGLFNRRGCDVKLKDIEIEQVHSSLIIDIDHFKAINDNFGHFIGDKVIQRIANIIQLNINKDDIAVRFGGEEFLVVMVNKTKNQAFELAEKIRLAVKKLKLIQKGSQKYLPQLTVSVGVAQRQTELNWHDLFEQADTALYQAKNSGRNKSVCL